MLATPELLTAGTGLYTLPEAALYSRLHPAVLGRWLFGNKSGGRVLSPQIADDEQRAVTFLDFVQALAVRSIRQQHRLSLDKIRTLKIVDEVYLYSVKAKQKAADKTFADWLLSQ